MIFRNMRRLGDMRNVANVKMLPIPVSMEDQLLLIRGRDARSPRQGRSLAQVPRPLSQVAAEPRVCMIFTVLAIMQGCYRIGWIMSIAIC